MKLILQAIVLLALLIAAPLAAEQLVLRDGTAVEIEGGYEQRGALVVFTLANGTLGSLRAAEVDFEATAAANRPSDEADEADEAEEASAPTAPARPTPEPVLVLTNADLPAVPPPSAPLAAAGDGADDSADDGADDGADDSADDGTAGSPADGGATAAASVFVPLDGALAVTGWSVEDSGTVDGLELVGTLVNGSAVLAVDIAVTVSIGGADSDDGGDARTFEAFVANPTLGPGRRTSFRVPLRDEFTAPESPAFVIAGRGLRPRIVPEPAVDGAAGDQPPDAETAGGLNDDTSGSPRDRRP